MQSDDDCCNSCEEVREAYRKKGWAMTNADLIDQVNLTLSLLWAASHNTARIKINKFLFFGVV